VFIYGLHGPRIDFSVGFIHQFYYEFLMLRES